MSYDIKVDILGSNGSSAVNNTFRRGNTLNQRKLDIIAFIRRALFFRSRLKLLKFYMATIVILIVLFLLFRSQVPPDDHANAQEYKPVISSQFIDGQATTYEGLSRADMRVENKPPQDPYVGLVEKSKFPDNLTHSLSLVDFGKSGNNLMQIKIREAMKHSWDNYRKYAWGYDMLKPRSKEADHWFNLGLTIVDSVDTLMMMGLVRESKLAVDWIENDLNFRSENENSNCFEMTIRVLAGILSAYHLSGREKLKQQAISMGDILLKCYSTESQIIPYSDIDLKSQRAHPPQWNPHSSLSEVASLQLEFRYLAQISGNSTYEQTTFKTSEHIHKLLTERKNKLLPMYINPSSGQLEDSVITLGARSDSYYEYLLKQYLQTGIKWLETDYLDAIDEIKEKMLKHTGGPNNYTYVAEMQIYRTINDTEDIKYFNKMDHLVCFLPGTLILGYYHFSPQASDYRIKYNLETPDYKINSRYDSHLNLAKALARTCYHMYSDMGTGLSPEIATFVHVTESNPSSPNGYQPELQVQSTSAHNILRPEFVESLFYLYHITGLPIYRVQAGKVFDAFQKYSRITTGYSPVSDVRHKPPDDANIDELLHKNAPDRMDSFWLSETLKYLYLTFCDDHHIISTLLNSYIFNTEAHMLPILKKLLI